MTRERRMEGIRFFLSDLAGSSFDFRWRFKKIELIIEHHDEAKKL